MNLNKIFTSHMVFQAHKPIRVFGEGTGRVKLNFAGKEIIYTSYEPKWMVEFPAMEYGGPYTMTVEFENRTVLLEDIYVGEVYLFSGQSNMDFSMRYQKDFNPESYESDEKLRLFVVKDKKWNSRFSVDSGWQKCESKQIINWSALAYFAGSEIRKKKDVAVGVVVCAFGASVIESWVPDKTFEKIGINLTDEQKFIDHTYEEYSGWNKNGYLYENELSQIMPFSFSTVVWYQGESDVSIEEAAVYLDELRELIRVWRKGFCADNLPFVVVQLTDFTGRADTGWALVQKAQSDVQYLLDNVKTVISRDVCEDDEIHPPTKDKLAHRIAETLINRM